MTEIEKQREELIKEMQQNLNKKIIDVLYEINDISYIDNYCKVRAGLVYSCDDITRSLAYYKKELDKINGEEDYIPW